MIEGSDCVSLASSIVSGRRQTAPQAAIERSVEERLASSNHPHNEESGNALRA
jgi:hypothetical protein